MFVWLEKINSGPGRAVFPQRQSRLYQSGYRSDHRCSAGSGTEGVELDIEFEELDYRQTPLGELILRRRTDPLLKKIVFEIKLGEEFLMSSLFTAGETALARIALERCAHRRVDVVVGGLGLGFTAAAALEDECVASLLVVEALQGVIDWHRQGLVPLGPSLIEDPRCRLVCGDFFAGARQPPAGFDPLAPGRRFDVALLDIDHSPREVLHVDHSAFYHVDGLRNLRGQLRAEGVFAMWSNDPPDEDFTQRLNAVFPAVETRVVTFDNPYQSTTSSCTIYIAQRD